MPYSYTNFTGDGVTTVRNVSFPYLDQADIKVKVNGVDTAFSWLTSNTIQITPASPSGAIGEIRRTSLNSSPIVEFQDASVLTEEQLNLLALYDQYIAEEASDAIGQTISQDSTGVFQGLSRRAANFANPTAPQDLATKAYVDSTTPASAAAAAASAAAAAASEANATTKANNAATSEANAATSAAQAAAAANGMKYRSVRAGSTANVASLSGTITIDGVSLASGERVLLKDQTTPSQNGIYVVAAGAWSRASDMDTWSEVVSTVVVIEEGTVNADLAYICTSNQGGTLGSTAITFVPWQSFIPDGSLTTQKYADGSLTTQKLNDSVVDGLTAVPVASNDYMMIADTSDSNKKKKSLISGLLDAILGTTQGAIAYRGASGWLSLAVGTAGQFLKTNGAGADPSWANVTGGVTSATGSGGVTVSSSTGAVTFSIDTNNPAGIGCYGIMFRVGGSGTTLSGATESGSHIGWAVLSGSSSITLSNGGVPSGTWRNISGLTANPQTTGLWIRSA